MRDLDLADAGQVEHELVVVEAAGVEARRARGAQRAVERPLDGKLHLVVAVDQRRIHLPVVPRPLTAKGRAPVGDVGRNQRQETVGVDLDDVAVVERPAEETGRACLAVLVARPAIEPRAAREDVTRVREQRVLRELGLAVPGVEAIDRLLARVVGAVHARVLLARVPAVALGAGLVLPLAGER